MNAITARFHLQQGDFLLDADFVAPARGVTALFGTSGAGKSTLLRCIAGLHRVPDGFLQVRDELWQAGSRFLPVHRRAVGYVFQEPSLFPHLTVRGNLDYGYRRTPPRERRLHPDEVIALLGIEPLLMQRPDTLSGGQRQRVAIGRALLASPRLLLMDEPLASLDLASRAEILPYLEQLHDRLDLPVIYVSHAPGEVARLADHLLLMERGRIVASGALNTLLTDPALPLAQLDEAAAVLTGCVTTHDREYGLMAVALGDQQLWVAHPELPPGHRVRLRILARDVSVALTPAGDSSINNVLSVTVTRIETSPAAAHALLNLQCDDGQAMLARITRRSVDRLALCVGARVFAQIKSAALWR